MVANLESISDPNRVKKNFAKYKGSDNAQLLPSEKADKKYKVVFDGKTTHFGSKMEDYTKHLDPTRLKSYLARAKAIKGDWKKNKYSANNLSINLLWA
jgi:hypothetical protein